MKLAKRLSIVGMAIAGTIGLAGPHAEAAQTCAKPKYVIPIVDQEEQRWRKFKLYAYPLHICKRPEVLRTGALA